MLLLITYEPDPATGDETDASENVQKSIEESAKAHIHPLTACWLVETDEDIDLWATRLAPIIEPGRLLITRVRGHTNGQLPVETWEWINARAT